MEADRLKARAPDLCAMFDRFCKAAGRPGMKVGGEEWNAVARREAARMETIPDALLIPLAETVQRLMDEHAEAEKRGELTEADWKRFQRLLDRANAFERRIYACDRIGIFH